MLTTLKSGSIVLIHGIAVHICKDVEVEVDESLLASLSPGEADSLSIPCTRRHPHPPGNAIPGPLPAGMNGVSPLMPADFNGLPS